MSNLRFVMDTNALVSASILEGSRTFQAYDKARTSGILLISKATQSEIEEVLMRKKFDRYLSRETRLEFIESLVESAELVSITETITICRDSKDDKFLEVAVCGKATCIISGDDDLQSMSPFRDIPIYSPAAFMELSFSTPD